MNKSHHKRSLQQHYSLRKLRGVIGVAFAMLTAVSTTAVTTQAQSSTPAPVEIRTLTPNAVVRRRIEPGTTHIYELTLGQQEFARISVEQRGADLRLTAVGPAGSAFSVAVDNPNGFFGPETVSLLAPVAGTYRIEVAFPSTLYPPGDYELQVDGPRPTTASDEIHISAERVFAEGQAIWRTTPTRAIDKYTEAIRLWRQVGDLRQQGYAFTNTGRAHTRLSHLTPASQNLSQALTLLRQAGDLPGQAFALNESGSAHRELGDLRQADVLYQEAVRIRIGLGDRFGVAQTYTNLGLTYSYMGHQPRALDHYTKALAIWRELNARNQEVTSIINSAKAHAEMGELEVARAEYQRVLEYCNAELNKENSPLANNARFLKPSALNGLGLVDDSQANADAALINYHEALNLFRELSNKAGEANVLDNIGMTYAFLGDAQRAVEHFKQALLLREETKEPRPWAITLSNLGYAYALLGRYPEAQQQLNQALPLSANTHDRRFEAYTLLRLGMTYVEMPDPQPLKALEYYEKTLAIQREPDFEDRRGQAITLDKIAAALALSGQQAAALKKYEEAIELWQTVGDQQGQANSLYGIARIERDRFNLANARDRIEEAIRIIEKLRNIVTGRQLQMIYFAGKQDMYALAIDVRMRLYDATKATADLEAAVAFSEKTRARSLLDLLSEARADLFKGIPPRLAERILSLDREISELTQNLVRFRGVNAKQDSAEVQQKLERRINEHDRLLAPLKKRAPAHQGQTLSPKEIQQLLDDDMVLLQFSLGEKRSYLWAITRTSISPHYLPGKAEIENAANHLRQALRDKEAQRERESQGEAAKRRQSATERYWQTSSDLSRLILADVAPQLGNKRLVVVADGSLHYIPFEALPLPDPAVSASATSHRSLLLMNNETIYQPSASALAMLRRTRRPIASKRVAILADPVFNKEDTEGAARKNGSNPLQVAKSKLTRSLRDIGDIGTGDYSLQRLEYSLKEANEIARVAPRGSMKAVQFKASRALATGPLLKKFGFVHFATHGILNEKNPELSGIVLSMVNERGQPEDGYLTLRDIYTLDLPAYMVVVSACETGVSASVQGEGLIGLTRGFMNAGAQSVVVSLWRVDDEATAELMKRFYTNLFGKQPMSRAAALRQAKIEMKDNYHPYRWAGFVLQGDWK